jgi:A/G-specific adenine glycosylase
MSQRAHQTRELAAEEIERILWLREQLLFWFERNGRCFPWRDPGRSPYEVVVVEILLQHTAAASVARAYHGFFERFPSWTTLARSPVEDIQVALKPLGLWRQKAQVFKCLAQTLEEGGGEVPRSRAELERLRGIGPYTASAVLAIVYGQDEPLIDVNMARLLGRSLGLPACAGGSRQRLPHALPLCLVSGEQSLQVNWAVLDFGALVCRARYPRCSECPLQAKCRYFTLQERRPTPTSGVPSG